MRAAATRFRALHYADRPLLLPNAWDVGSAAALIRAGFGAVGTTSLGVAAAHGLPDAEGRARAETVALARRLCRLPCLVTVDIEAGFSDDPAEVAELVAELAEVGAAGVNLEDGRPGGQLAEPADQAALIRAVKARCPDVFLNARTDTYWLAAGSPSPAEAVARARSYAEAGADGVFVPGLRDPARITTLVTAVDRPVNVLYAPGGPTLDELAGLGVRRVSTGSLLFRAGLDTAVRIATQIRDSAPVPSPAVTYQDVQRLVHLATPTMATPPDASVTSRRAG